MGPNVHFEEERTKSTRVRPRRCTLHPIPGYHATVWVLPVWAAR